MRSYDFNHSFSAEEFQNFARDMMQIRENLTFESFSEGRDMGIDGRFVADDGNTVILQVKKLKNPGARIRKIMGEEKAKLDRLAARGKRVDRYILVLSEDLLAETKDAVCQLMAPYIRCPQDLVMKGDLNNLLSRREYREVEDTYYQLWLPSANIVREKLFGTVNGRLMNQSAIYYEKALRKREVFVKTDVFEQVILQLQKNSVIIISGEPGVGKTTLAEQAALYYFAKYKFHAFLSASSMEDLYTALGMEGKKVILYDDFWGSNAFDKLEDGRRSGELATFIAHIRKKKNCLLIMTTREYILEQGLKENEELRRLVEKYKLECRIEQYSDSDKLRIYYGHLKSAGLTWEQTKALQEESWYVMHSPNYNPRLIELFTESVSIDMSPEACVREFHAYLKCPADFWKKIFHDLSGEAKVLYMLLLIFPMPAERDVLEKSYGRVRRQFENTFDWKSFSEIIAELENTVIRTDLYSEIGESMLTVTFQNPSARDFLFALLRDNFETYHPLLLGACEYYAQYVEYLKVLDAVHAPAEIYSQVFEKAAAAIHSSSILFYDRYKTVLSRSNALETYYARYETERDYRDIGYGRVFQLLLMYKKGCKEAMEARIRALFLAVLQAIESYPDQVLAEDMQALPNVVIAMYRTGICDRISWMLDVCMDCFMRNRVRIEYLLEKIKSFSPQIYSEYTERRRERITGYIQKYYDAEMCVAAASGDAEEFVYQMLEYDDACEQFNIEIGEAMRKNIEQYDAWVTAEEEKDSLRGHAEPKRGRVPSAAEIQEDFKENFLHSIFPKYVGDIGQWLDAHMAPEGIKEIVNAIENHGHAIWGCFLHDEESLKFLEAFAEYAGGLPEKMEEIFTEVTRFLEETGGLQREELGECMARLTQNENSKEIWSRKELENMYADLLFENDELLDRMAEAHILVNKYHWYRLSNPILPFIVQMEAVLSDDAQVEKYYLSYRQQIEAGDAPEGVWPLWETLHQLNPAFYEKYIWIPAIHTLYGEIEQQEGTWLNGLIAFLNMEINFNEEEITGYSCTGDDRFQILEVYLDYDLLNLFPETFTDSQILRMKQQGALKAGEKTVALKELEACGLLEELGIYGKLEELWSEICRWQIEG